MYPLPKQFEDLDGFVHSWALATEAERNRKRLSSPMEEIRTFYNALLPRMDEIIAYLNQYPLGQLPEDAKSLFYLTLSFMEISPAIEIFGEPDESAVFPAERFRILEP